MSTRPVIDRRCVLAGLASAATLIATDTLAQTTYPNAFVKIIVPFPAGGGADVLARLVTAKMAEVLGQQFVVENRAGAGGNVGSVAAVRAQADGYTVLYGTNGTLATNHFLYASAGFDPKTELEPVSRLSEIPLVLVVHPSVPANSVKELIAHAKANPGKLNIATAGNGTTSHLAGEMFKKATSVEMQAVHFRGGAQAIQDLVAGHVQVMIEVMPSAMPQVISKTVRALGVSTAARWPRAPDIPTIAESGVEGFVVTAWDALLVPKGTPADVIAKLNEVVGKALGDPQMQQVMLDRGARAVPGTPADLRTLMDSEFRRWGDVVRAFGVKIE